MSAKPDSTLANPEQRIADLERQLAECQAERDEGLQRETATAEVLGVINSSPGDLAPVFTAILEKATQLCEAPFGVLRTWDGERFHLAAAQGDPEFTEWARGYGPFAPAGPSSPAGRIVSGEEVVRFADAPEEEALSISSGFRALVEASGMRRGVSVALRKDGSLRGNVTVYRQEVRPFSDKQIALLQNFAAQAVIAIENARLLGELRERTSDLEETLEYQTATSDVLKVISRSTFDLQAVLDTLVATAARLCGAIGGYIVTRDEESFRPVATIAPSPEVDALLRGLSFKPRRGTVTGEALLERRAVHVADIAADPAYASSLAVLTALGDRQRGLLSVPLLREGELIGAITLSRSRVEPFTNKQIELVTTFADQAVIAMENARLINETREALEQQTATAEVLQVINASPGDLQPVFNTILKKVVLLCGAAHAILRTLDSNLLQLAAAYSEPEVAERLGQLGPINLDRVPPGHHLGRIMRGERVVHVSDVQQTDTYREIPTARERMKTTGMRTCLAVALHQEKALLGVITAYRKEVRPFTQKEISLLENFAAQAEIAMENARLLSELHQRTDEVAELNRGLEARVAEQVEELGRVGRLKRFLAPQLAELIVSQGDENILESHRREIVVVFCDLRGYTPFTETAEPEDQLNFLREYHGSLGPLVSQYEGTLDHFAGDGIMVFFNDPVPCPDPAERAVKMAMAMREAAAKLIAAWRRHGCELGFGIGIAQGYATLGRIGFSDHSGYTAIGTVCNLAARLCDEAKDGQILVSSRIAEAVEAVAKLEDLGNLELKGLRRPVGAFNVVQSTSAADARPNLTVVARGPEA